MDYKVLIGLYGPIALIFIPTEPDYFMIFVFK